MLYFELIFIVFLVFFSFFFTEKVPTCQFRHNDLAAVKLSLEKCVLQKNSGRKIGAVCITVYITVLTSIFYPNHTDYQKFQY